MTALLLPALLLASSQSPVPTGWLDALSNIEAVRLRSVVTYLASDEMEGRDSPSAGLDKSAAFIAKAFEDAGLEKGGNEGYLHTTSYTNRRGEEGRVANVVGILRGTDSELKNTYILLTAHYDHLGKNDRLEGDQIFNGANDNASGTAGVMEVAHILSRAKLTTKRSIVFVAFWGEEKGLLGARHFIESTPIPIDKIVGVINLEQIGRTDDNEAPRVAAVSITGFDYSTIGKLFESMQEPSGVKAEMHPRNSDAYFAASDNLVFAQKGIPAHTVCTAFMFPDYHKVSDHADKLDYDNMAKILRLVTLGVLSLADSDQVPRWNPENPRAKRYHDIRSGRAGN
jgi:hypothetical protein